MVTCSKKKKLKKCRKSNSDEIPQHLVMEIIRRLPAKSVARSCSSQPRLLVCFIGRTKPCKRQYCYFFSSSSSSTTFLSRVKCPREDPECFPCLPHYANGLMRLGYGEKKLICNPSTGKSIALPKVKNMMSVSKNIPSGPVGSLINYEGRVAVSFQTSTHTTVKVWVVMDHAWMVEKKV
ncbi:hypothetical protein F2Q70_00014363 [Brassica cretica]|uniref:F-box associated beta-propeller type 3 domain-containing protein n=1 Tax=Brassica cretica TaxID=69181 RepID=A0A8S9HUR9_BRACR|nr:hypothetical protein F2Q70_00014363 [Brassica cretica]